MSNDAQMPDVPGPFSEIPIPAVPGPFDGIRRYLETSEFINETKS